MQKRFTISMQRKLVVLFLLVLLAFVGLGVRLFLIGRDQGQAYSMKVLSQQAYDNQTIPYKRGQILDSKGTVLADSQLVYSVIVDAYQILDKEYYLEPTLDELQRLGIDREEIARYIREQPASRYYIALKNLPYQKRKEFLDRIEAGAAQEEENDVPQRERHYDNVRGIWFDPSYIRTYPLGELACDVIGFANNNNVGMAGLEEYYNDTLNGVAGRQYGYLDDSLNMDWITHDARDGNTLQLTIDANIQRIVEKHLKAFNEEHKNDYRKHSNGAYDLGCIIMDVNTGAVKAMAGYPFYDLNNPYDTDALIGAQVLNEKDEPTSKSLTAEDLETMPDEEKARYLNYLWKNFCIAYPFEPGSTGKLITVAAGLETGKIKEDDEYYCNGFMQVADAKIYCHNVNGHRFLNLGEAVERSCNVYMMNIITKIGAETFAEYQNVFNLGLKTNIDLAGEARTDALLQPADQMGPVDLATNSFGQNYEITMIQFMSAFCSIVNGGYYYQPYVVDKIISENGAVISKTEPKVIKRTISEATSAKMRKYCEMVVMTGLGTGEYGRPYGYAIGGKTGTAETLPRGNDEYISSFMAFAPVDDPQVAIYVVVNRANAKKQGNHRLPCEICRDILQEVLPYMGIYMDQPVTQEEAEILKKKGLEITYQKGN